MIKNYQERIIIPEGLILKTDIDCYATVDAIGIFQFFSYEGYYVQEIMEHSEAGAWGFPGKDCLCEFTDICPVHWEDKKEHVEIIERPTIKMVHDYCNPLLCDD